jgi:small-conductance mechanosensitive channel
MAVKRPIAVGELIETNGFRGLVEKIELRTTVIETLDGRLIRIPNKEIFQKPITNLSRRPTRRVDIEVGVSYRDDLETASEVAHRAVSDLERDDSRDVEVFFTGFGSSSIDLVVRFWIQFEGYASYLSARSSAVQAIKNAFDESEITIPFPIRTLDIERPLLEAIPGQLLGSDQERASERPSA